MSGDGHFEQKETPRIVWFKPSDKRVPLIAIPIEQVPENFVSNSEDYQQRLFVVGYLLITTIALWRYKYRKILHSGVYQAMANHIVTSLWCT